MKQLKVFFLLLLGILLFTNCNEDDLISPELTDADFENTAISYADDEFKRPFEGVCTFVAPVPNTWYDDCDDWRVTGLSIWTQPDETIFSGTFEIFVDAKNKHDENRGKWEGNWEGEITFNEDGATIVASVTGEGVDGKVEGLEATWTYTMNYVGPLPFDPTNPTFFYRIEGNIHKPSGNSSDE